ncbi:MAG: hypothetical protein JJ863_03245 [Deltaproteobacteria bacterium]|nr:hypothetical protein [Deltaproteobacteria bacterium]
MGALPRVFARRPSRGHCPRCDRQRRYEVPSRAWGVLKVLWFATIAFMAVWTLAISADVTFMTPFAITILFGGGFIFDRAAEPVRCSYCRLPIEE